MKEHTEYIMPIDCPLCKNRGNLKIQYRVGKRVISFHAFYCDHRTYKCYLGKKVEIYHKQS